MPVTQGANPHYISLADLAKPEVRQDVIEISHGHRAFVYYRTRDGERVLVFSPEIADDLEANAQMKARPGLFHGKIEEL